MVLLDGATGASLEAGVYWNDRVAFAQSFEAAPAVGVFGGERRLVVASFDTPNKTSKLTSYALRIRRSRCLADVRSRCRSKRHSTSMLSPAASAKAGPSVMSPSRSSSTTLSSGWCVKASPPGSERSVRARLDAELRPDGDLPVARSRRTNGQPGARVRGRTRRCVLRRGSPVGEGPGHHQGDDYDHVFASRPRHEGPTRHLAVAPRRRTRPGRHDELQRCARRPLLHTSRRMGQSKWCHAGLHPDHV